MHYNYDKFRLRWRFNYADKHSRYGVWSRPAERPEDMAAFNNRGAIVSATIESQDVTNDSVRVVAECSGSDFVNFEWIATATGFDTSTSQIVGLTLVTSNERCSVYVDGSAAIHKRSEDEKRLNLATFGK